MARTAMIFDCDGTLLNSIDTWDRILSGVARDAGITFTDEDNELVSKLTIPETGVYFHGTYGIGESPEDVVEQINRGMMGYYSNHARERVGALDFVKDLVNQGITCSVLSSSPQMYLRAGLKRAGFSDYLYEIVSVDDVDSSKREPKAFLHTCSLMGADPRDTWVVEDSLYALITAKDAGFKTLAVYDRDEAGTFEELSEVADMVVRKFTELNARMFVQ